MRKRVIKNMQEVIQEIGAHTLWELEPLLPPNISLQLREFDKGNFRNRHNLLNSGFYFLCPFHEEKTASCWYTLNNGAIFCFGCGTYCENLLYFYIKIKQAEFFPSIIRLAKFFKIKLEWKNETLEGKDAQIEKYHRRIRRWK